MAKVGFQGFQGPGTFVRIFALWFRVSTSALRKVLIAV